MTTPIKQHLIDPEICIRCYTCEATCSIDAITHDDNNVVVDYSKCNYCMDCIAPCPTGSIDEWRVVETPYTLEEQLEWGELPPQKELSSSEDAADTSIEAFDASVVALLNEAHKGAGGKARAPASASKPSINIFTISKPAEAVVQGNYRLTDENSDSDVRHIILDLGSQTFPVLEGQSIGVCAPGVDEKGDPHLPRLYSVSSPRDGERPNHNNLSLTVKREEQGVCSNYLCDLSRGDKIKLTGPYGSTFLLPGDPQARLLMICTGTGSAPFRAFTMRRQRTMPELNNTMALFFGARSPEGLPYFGPLKKVPDSFLSKSFAFSRVDGQPKKYVQDRLLDKREMVAEYLKNPNTNIFICGLKAMEEGVEQAFEEIAKDAGITWMATRDAMREAGRYHVETY